MGLELVTSGGNIELSLGHAITTTAPSDWAEMVAEYGIGYNYPQPTGQTTSYRTGDDYDIESSLFAAAVRAANGLKPRQSLASFLVLNNNNSFGNTDRFTDDAGGQTYANDYVIDNYTGLGWYRVFQATANWNDHIDNALASTNAGFSDWFLPNTYQQKSIAKNIVKPFNYDPFNMAHSFSIISSTVDSNTTKSYYVSQDNGTGLWLKTSATLQASFCRKHF